VRILLIFTMITIKGNLCKFDKLKHNMWFEHHKTTWCSKCNIWHTLNVSFTQEICGVLVRVLIEVTHLIQIRHLKSTLSTKWAVAIIVSHFVIRIWENSPQHPACGDSSSHNIWSIIHRSSGAFSTENLYSTILMIFLSIKRFGQAWITQCQKERLHVQTYENTGFLKFFKTISVDHSSWCHIRHVVVNQAYCTSRSRLSSSVHSPLYKSFYHLVDQMSR